ncbi:hypothetical protein [Nitrospira sp. BLG_2]|uniref:hypothetical protein n=1 Tax=Nitrospira sp. BLG_2 TaxID=3397507 RepID=UPI003B9D484D
MNGARMRAGESIIEAGRATVILPAANFLNLDTITTLGASTYTIPGSGQVELEITVFGAGGGGSCSIVGSGITPWIAGPPGGNGGKATTFIALPAGSVLSLFVGTGGSGGVFLGPNYFGASGMKSEVEHSGIIIAQANGGGGGTNNAGAPGYGLGDHIFRGDGAVGGAGGPATGGTDGSAGQHGWIEIRY